MPKSVTLKDVAREVGISSMAVSMALSGNPRISEKTREDVRSAVKKLGYIPSAAAKALRSQQAKAISLIVPNSAEHVFSHLYFMHILTGMAAVAGQYDSQLIISTNAEVPTGGSAYERILRSRAADGVILTSAAIEDADLEQLITTRLPVVLIGNYPQFEHTVTVSVDDVAAASAITEHLVVKHHRNRLLHVSGSLAYQTGVDRKAGFLATAQSLGVRRADVIEGELNEESGARIARQLLETGGDFPYDGIVFANDDMAIGALPVLKAAGLRIPQDVAVVGFDDFGFASIPTPSITTVHVPVQQMSRVATEQLFKIINKEEGVVSHTVMDTEIVERESCGCVAPAALTGDKGDGSRR